LSLSTLDCYCSQLLANCQVHSLRSTQRPRRSANFTRL
jgi:hypothetical protein